MAINVLEPIKTNRVYQNLLVVTDRLLKLVRTLTFKSKSAVQIAKPFITQWVMTYCPRIWSLLDNGVELMVRFFQNFCKILDIENLFARIYHPQPNSREESFNSTLMAISPHIIRDHWNYWYLYNDVITLAYSPQVSGITNCPHSRSSCQDSYTSFITTKPNGSTRGSRKGSDFCSSISPNLGTILRKRNLTTSGI